MAIKARAQSIKFGPEFGRRMTRLLGSAEAFESFTQKSSELIQREEKSLRLNPLRAATIARLQGLGVEVEKSLPWLSRSYWARLKALEPLDSHPLLGSGYFYLQEAGASEAVTLLDVKPGHLVLDLCAAPGGKSTQIGEDLQGKGWLVANEPVRSRAERLNALLGRHGVLNTSVFALDPTSMASKLPAFFDRILVDAPCSGESLFSKRKELRGDVRDADVLGCARRQFVILDRAAEMLKSGGLLVYSTCTYAREENEDLVRSFLESHENFEILKEQRRWPHVDGVAGGYAALLRKRSGPESSVDFRDLLAMTAQGALRQGPYTWQGELDEYALAMAAVRPETQFAEALSDHFNLNFEVGARPRISIDLALARDYLRGQALDRSKTPNAENGLACVEWEGLPLGLVKSVENRMNNLLPKILRGLA